MEADIEWYKYFMEYLSYTDNILDHLPEPDLILVAGEDGYEFAVHKRVMFSGSKYFKRDQYGMDKIIIENMKSEVLDVLITAIYGGTVKFTDYDLAEDVEFYARKWDLDLLYENVSAYLYECFAKRMVSTTSEEGDPIQITYEEYLRREIARDRSTIVAFNF